MSRTAYYQESFELALEAMGLGHIIEQLTPEQRLEIGESLSVSADHASDAFCTPPSSDRIANIERDWQTKYNELADEFAKFRSNAETAVKRSLNLKAWHDVVIKDHGLVEVIEG